MISKDTDFYTSVHGTWGSMSSLVKPLQQVDFNSGLVANIKRHQYQAAQAFVL